VRVRVASELGGNKAEPNSHRRDRLLQLLAKAHTQSFKKLAIRLATCSAWSCRGFGAKDFNF
jgi:hypothetical protein